MQISDEWDTIAHRADYEGRPGNRPFTREELQRFFDYADEQVDRARRLGRKGWLAAFRDATLFKCAYACGPVSPLALVLLDAGAAAIVAPRCARCGKGALLTKC